MAASSLAPAQESQTQITLVLDMQPEEFLKVQGAFLQGLAEALGVGPEESTIVSVRYGCAKVGVITVVVFMTSRLERVLKCAEMRRMLSALP
jgi:hypothetical protein